MDVKYAGESGLNKLISLIKGTYVKKTDIVDNCESSSTDQPLSANQGRVIQDQINAVNKSLSGFSNEEGSVKKYIDNSIDNIDTLNLPDYWEEYLPDKIEAIKALQAEGGEDAFSFIVITDIHYGNNGYGDYGVGGWSVEKAKADGKIGNEGWSPILAKRIADECNIKYVLCLGDVYNRYAQGQTIDNVWEELDAIKEMLAPIKDRLLITRGNHDVAYGRYDKNSDGSYTGVGDELMCYNLTENELHEFFYRPVSLIDGVHFDESGTGYYVDDTANKVRFIVLNTHCNPSALAEDGTALYNSYGTFRFTQSQFDLVEEALMGIPSNSWSVVVASHAPIAGSYGVDESGDQPFMRRLLNAYQNKTTYTGEFAGTGGVVEDEIELPYTNLSDATTKLTAPADSNQDGWFIDYRIKSNGTPYPLTGTHVTNFIPIKDSSGNKLATSYLRIKGLDVKTDGNLHAFNSAKTFIIASGSMANSSGVTFDGDTSIIKITPASLYDPSLGDVYYIRLQGQLMDGYTVDDVVITIDEEIVEIDTGTSESTDKPYDYVSINADFTTAKGQIIGYFSGHTHKDQHIPSSDYDWSIETITSRCDGRAEDSASEAVLNANRTVGTITEQSFNVFTVNRKSNKIYATKIGAGSDRTIVYGDGVINENAIDDLPEHEERIAALEDRVTSLEDVNESSNSIIVPSYWKTAVDALSDTIKERQDEAGAQALQFVWFSDPHGVVDQETSDTITSRVTDIGRVAQYAAEKFDIPYVAISGDIMSQAVHSAESGVLAEYEEMRELLSSIDRDKLIYCKGNHDGSYATVDGVGYMKNIGNKAIYNAIYRRQALERSRVFGGDGSYFYTDDNASKVRFIMLNGHTDGDSSVDSNGCAVYNSQKNGVYGTEQLAWLANVALDVPEEWGVILMAHQPIIASKDGEILNGILKAYNNKTSYSGSVDVSGNYWGNGVTDATYKTVTANVNFADAKGEVIAMFTGHTHQDLVYAASDYGYACPVIVITTAGADVRGNNTNYNRVVGTATETAMDIVTVDRLNKKIYCTRLGAGVDRIISYSGATIVTYSITNTLTNCTNSNGVSTIGAGKPYSGTIAANSGYVLDSVKVTMGGTDVTSSVYTDGTISIGAVTGNIVVTANAVAEAAKTYTVTNTLTKCANSNGATVVEEGTSYTATITPNTGYNLGTVKVTMGGTDITSTVYSNGAINIASVTDNIVITATATIKTFSVTKNLTNCSISNSASTVNYGSAYSATITASDGYTLDSVSVTMGGNAVSVTNGVISISNVTGDIVITASAVEAGSAYTNLIPLSTTEPGGTEIYNDVGYKNGIYWTTGGAEGTDSTTVGSGWIPVDCKYNSQNFDMYVKGVTVDSSVSHNRWLAYNTSGSTIVSYNTTWSQFVTVKELDTQYYKLTFNCKAFANQHGDTTHIKLTFTGTGENLIVTINEPIVD